MKVTIEATDKFESVNGEQHRVWQGATDKGVPVLVYVRTLSPQTHDETMLADFDRELKALPPPRRTLVSFDMRIV